MGGNFVGRRWYQPSRTGRTAPRRTCSIRRHRPPGAVPVNGRMPAENFMNFARHCGARTLVSDCAGARELLAKGRDLNQFDRIFLTDGWLDIDDIPVISMPNIFALAPTSYVPPHMDRDQHVMICHTSGTTGTPKGVLHGSDNFMTAARGQLKIQFITRRNKAMLATSSAETNRRKEVCR